LSKNLDKNAFIAKKQPSKLGISMKENAALLLVLVFLTASCTVVTAPVWVSAAVVEDSWVSKAPMQVARFGLGVAVVGGKIYAIGGSGDGALGTNEEYDPVTDTWVFKSSMPVPSSGFATAVYEGKIYCIGGEMNQVYDPANDSWENKTAMPTARTSLQANVVNGKIYLIGGAIPDNTRVPGFYSSSVNEVYDPATDFWTTKTPMPNATSSSASVTVDNKIYIIGGVGPEHPGSSLNQIYDPETDTWTLGATPPPGIAYGAAGATTGVNAPKRIYFVYVDGTQIYDPINNSWAFGADVPTKRFSLAVAVVNDLLYVIGGCTVTYDIFWNSNVTRYATTEQYTPIGYGTPDPSPSSSPPQSPSFSPSPSPSPSSSKQQLEFTYATATATAAIAIIIITAIALKKRHRKNTN